MNTVPHPPPAPLAYSVNAAAHALHYSPRTIRLWIQQGRLKAVKLSAGGGYRIPASALDNFIARAQAERTGGAR